MVIVLRDSILKKYCEMAKIVFIIIIIIIITSLRTTNQV